VFNLGGGELLLIPLVLAAYAIPVWAIVDAAQRSDDDFRAIGASKSTQIVVLVLSALLCGPLGLIASAIYLLTTRPLLRSLTPV
jgi:hypothetical protein